MSGLRRKSEGDGSQCNNQAANIKPWTQASLSVIVAVSPLQSHSRGRRLKPTNCVAGLWFHRSRYLYLQTRCFSQTAKCRSGLASERSPATFSQTVIFFLLLCWFVGSEASSGYSLFCAISPCTHDPAEKKQSLARVGTLTQHTHQKK